MERKRLFIVAATCVAAGLFVLPASALDRTKTPSGANHAKAHAGDHRSTGAGVSIGQFEASGGIDAARTRIDDGGRLIRNKDFTGLTQPLPNNIVFDVNLPNAAADVHATVVAEVLASSSNPFTGVAPGSQLYVGHTPATSTRLVAMDWYYRRFGVSLFNMSLGGTVYDEVSTRSHTGATITLDAAGSTGLFTTNPFAFAAPPPRLHEVELTLVLRDGDTAAGEFDFNNLELRLDGVNLPIKLNGYSNEPPAMPPVPQPIKRTFVHALTDAQSTALLAELADGQLVGRIRRVADLPDSDSMDNSGNRLTPIDHDFMDGNGVIRATLTLRRWNDNGLSADALALDYHMNTFDTLVVKSAGNEGDISRLITRPGDFYNGLTVGATDDGFRARASFSSYILDGEGTEADPRGKPEILAPGTAIETEFYNPQNGTSFAAPHVTGVAALLAAGTEQTAGLALGTRGGSNHLGIKAIIMNSARKRHLVMPENAHPHAMDNAASADQAADHDYLNADGTLRQGTFLTGPKTAQWTPTMWAYNGTTFTAVRPLDDEQGTGVLDAERALIQLDGGQQRPGPVRPIGWDINSLSGVAAPLDYVLNFDLDAGDFLTTTLTWDRVVGYTDDGDGGIDLQDAFTHNDPVDFDLFVYYKDMLIGQSVAASFSGNNVEHLHIPLPFDGVAGDYRIRVDQLGMAAGATPYGLAWWTVPSPAAFPAGCALMLVMNMLRTRRGRHD